MPRAGLLGVRRRRCVITAPRSEDSKALTAATRANGRFIGVPDQLFRVILGGGQVGRVLGAIVHEQQRKRRVPGTNDPVPISGSRFQELTAMSHGAVYRALGQARNRRLIVVVKGGGRSKTSTYSLAKETIPPAGQFGGRETIPPAVHKLSHPETHIRKSDSGEPSIGPVPLSRPDEKDTPLRLGLDLLAVGVPVQIIKPDGGVIECGRDDHGPLLQMLGSNNPDLAVAALISDKPSPGVLSGREEARTSARLQRAAPRAVDEWPLAKVLSRLEDIGHRSVRKGDRWQSKCPLCGRRNVLEIKERRDAKVNVKCYRACDTEEVLGVIGLTMRDLYPPRLQ
jgi:hypothetical protein